MHTLNTKHLYCILTRACVWHDSLMYVAWLVNMRAIILQKRHRAALWTPAHFNTLQHTTTHCNTLQNTLQHTLTHCNIAGTSPSNSMNAGSLYGSQHRMSGKKSQNSALQSFYIVYWVASWLWRNSLQATAVVASTVKKKKNGMKIEKELTRVGECWERSLQHTVSLQNTLNTAYMYAGFSVFFFSSPLELKNAERNLEIAATPSVTATHTATRLHELTRGGEC